MSKDQAAIRLLLEIDPYAEPLRGRVRGAAAWIVFTGWTELGQSILRLTEAGTYDNSEEES